MFMFVAPSVRVELFVFAWPFTIVASERAGVSVSALPNAIGVVPGGAALLQRLLVGVKAALLHGLQEIFLWSAVIMTASILVHLMLKREPLRTRQHVEGAAAAAPAPAPAH